MYLMPKGNRLRRNRYSIENQIYHVTCCTLNRAPFFHDFYLARQVIRTMKFKDDCCQTKTFAFVVMPDHLHWLFQLKASSLSEVFQSVKSYSSNQAGFRLWQPGYHNHAVRREEDLVKLSRYIVANPLRKGLVEKIGDYPHWDAVWLTGKM